MSSFVSVDNDTQYAFIKTKGLKGRANTLAEKVEYFTAEVADSDEPHDPKTVLAYRCISPEGIKEYYIRKGMEDEGTD